MKSTKPLLTPRMRSASLRSRVLGVLAAVLLIAAAPAPLDSPVADAAMRGDRDAVRELLRQGEDANAAQGDGMTALHWAAVHDDAAMAEMLILAGARVGSITRNGSYTALHLAARAGSASVVSTLVEAGADMEAATSSGGARPLHFAAAQGDVATVTALLDGGAIVDARETAWDQTPLMWAAANDRVDAMNLLIARGAEIRATSKIENIPEREKIDRAAEQLRDRRVEALRSAEQPENANAQASGGRGAGSGGGAARQQARQAEAAERRSEPDSTKSESTAERRNTEADSATKNTAPRQPDRDLEPLSYSDLVGNKGGLTPLLFAVRQGNTEAAVTLLDAGADIDQLSADHTSPLLMATINGHFDLAMLLLERGADPVLASDANATPLYAAINVQWSPKSLYPQPTAYKQQNTTYLELMKALLEAGADPDMRLSRHLWYMSYNFDLLGVNTMGATPFWRAAYGTDVEAMKLLVMYGADPTIPTMKAPGRSRRGGNDDEDEDSEEDPSGLPPVPVGGPGVYPIHAASGVGYGEGYAANAHRHVPDGWLPAVKYLVEVIGADVNARDYNGYNAIHHAAARGDNELITYLVEKGGDVTAVSRRGQTTADMANGPVQRVPPFLETVALLEKLGSKNNHKCRSC